MKKVLRKLSLTNQIEVNKSKFIINIKRVENALDAKKFIEEISKKYKDATHNIPCYIVLEKNEIKYFANDQSEPKGTAGKPILSYLLEKKIVNIALVVTRYFGGVKLGKTRLLRAYLRTVKETITEDELTPLINYKIFTKKIEYSDFENFKNEIKNREGEVVSVDFKNQIEITYKLPVKKIDE